MSERRDSRDSHGKVKGQRSKVKGKLEGQRWEGFGVLQARWRDSNPSGRRLEFLHLRCTAGRDFPNCRVTSGLAHIAQQRRGMASQRQDLNARAFKLAVVVFRLFPKLAAAGPAHAYVARQLLRSVTSIGANLEEGTAASSRRDMAQKYSVSLRESREGQFWSRIIATDPRWSDAVAWIIQETTEFVAMLTVSVKKLRRPSSDAETP